MKGSVNDRLQALAERRIQQVATFCAARNAERQARVRIFYKVIKELYNEQPDDKKESWLNEQEGT